MNTTDELHWLHGQAFSSLTIGKSVSVCSPSVDSSSYGGDEAVLFTAYHLPPSELASSTCNEKPSPFAATGSRIEIEYLVNQHTRITLQADYMTL